MDRIEEVLREEERQIVISRTRIAGKYMAAPLVLSFTAIDYFFAPDLIIEFFRVRLAVIACVVSLVALYRLNIIKNKWYAVPSYFIALFLSFYNTYLAYRTGIEESAYYAGLNLIAIGGIYFLPLNFLQLTVLFFSIYGPYFLTVVLLDNQINTQLFVPNSAFMLSTAAMGYLVNYFFRLLRRSEITARLKLEDEINGKEEIIKKKTQEGIYLEKLASQFSPQVIEAIKTSKVPIDKKVRSEITCIFIDVQGSTGRSAKLDYSTYLKLLTEFFSECVEILLKHDVTVGTYLGDGLMAFTNAPYKTDDHLSRAMNACLDILRMHDRKKQYFSEVWRSEFNIRIGLNSGFAYVGFFPNENRGTYSAVGEAVNLTSRLCALSNQNSICVTKEVLQKLGKNLDDINVFPLGEEHSIKGFEGETFKLYSAAPVKVVTEKNGYLCPLCSAPVVEQADLGGTLLMKCSSCSFTDLIDKNLEKKTA